MLPVALLPRKPLDTLDCSSSSHNGSACGVSPSVRPESMKRMQRSKPGSVFGSRVAIVRCRQRYSLDVYRLNRPAEAFKGFAGRNRFP